MGHYRSEMGYDDRDAEEARLKAEHRATRTAKIQAAIDKNGVAAVLAEMSEDPTLFSIRYS